MASFHIPREAGAAGMLAGLIATVVNARKEISIWLATQCLRGMKQVSSYLIDGIITTF